LLLLFQRFWASAVVRAAWSSLVGATALFGGDDD
jgi:hypothetical protein